MSITVRFRDDELRAIHRVAWSEPENAAQSMRDLSEMLMELELDAIPELQDGIEFEEAFDVEAWLEATA